MVMYSSFRLKKFWDFSDQKDFRFKRKKLKTIRVFFDGPLEGVGVEGMQQRGKLHVWFISLKAAGPSRILLFWYTWHTVE